MENDFFLKKMKGVKPLNKDGIKKKEINKINNKTQTLKKNKKNENEKITFEQKKINTEFNISFGEINRDLKRGRVKIDRRLDLHGYSLVDAYDKFRTEVKKTYSKNKRCILVITGKGVHQNKNKKLGENKLFYGKIKNSIVSWINEEELKSYVLTYQDASFDYGGDGAIFVYLRKKRP